MGRLKIHILTFFICITISSQSQNIDIDILKSINKKQENFKDNYAGVVNPSVYAISLATPITIFAAGIIKKDKKLKENALYIAGSQLLCLVVTQSLKHTIDRRRPFEKYPFIIKRVDQKSGLSFPSGHTSAAFSTATSLSLYYPKWYVIIPSFIWCSSAAWTRMYQGVHYPSDVFTGAIVGAGSAWLGYKIQYWKDQVKKNNSHKHRKLILIF